MYNIYYFIINFDLIGCFFKFVKFQIDENRLKWINNICLEKNFDENCHCTRFVILFIRVTLKIFTIYVCTKLSLVSRWEKMSISKHGGNDLRHRKKRVYMISVIRHLRNKCILYKLVFMHFTSWNWNEKK